MRMSSFPIAAAFTFGALAAPGDPPLVDDPSAGSAKTERTIESRGRPGVDRAVERGLAWLAKQQLRCGGWPGDVGHKQEDSYVLFDDHRSQIAANRGHVGVTALAGLAFLAAGQVPGRGRYEETLDRAIAYLCEHANEYGYLTDSGTRMYSHAFAVLFLAQVEGMAKPRRQEVHDTLVRAAGFICETQNEFGAWRYSPFTTEADLSVTVCQVQALRSARDVGVHVPLSTIDRVIDYVKESRIEGGDYEGAFYYKIFGTSARSKTSYAINAAAVTTLHCSGVYDSALYDRAVRVIEDEYDDLSRYYPDHFYFWYGNWYATQAMNHVGGERFARFYAKLESDLLARQQPDGRWKNDVGPGDVFSTAVACALLRLPDQYLPTFQR
jgi:hypothetical protein